MTNQIITQLSRLFRARFPYIYITTWEEERATALIKKIANLKNLYELPEMFIFGHRLTVLC